jgi:hypothetical protein
MESEILIEFNRCIITADLSLRKSSILFSVSNDGENACQQNQPFRRAENIPSGMFRFACVVAVGNKSVKTIYFILVATKHF